MFLSRYFFLRLNLVCLGLLIGALNIQAEEIRYLMRSPQALFMGDAFTALADDEYTLFYNPAALSRNEKFDFSPLSADVSVTNALNQEDQDRFKDIPSNDTGALASRFTGFPLHGHIGYAPNIKIQNFGLSGVYNYTINIELNNAVHPRVKIDFRYDKGAIMGYSHQMKASKFSKLSVGAALKMIKREGLAKEFDLFGPTLLTLIDQSGTDLSSIKNSLGFSKGKAYGLDVGTLYQYQTPFFEFAWGTSILDVGDTRFKKTFGTDPIPRQEMYLNTGIAITHRNPIFDLKVAFDLHPLNVPMDFGRKVHIL